MKPVVAYFRNPASSHTAPRWGHSEPVQLQRRQRIFPWLDDFAFFVSGSREEAEAMRDFGCLDPTVLPTPAAYALYGWALSRRFESDAPISGTSSTPPEPLLEEHDS
jgi:hypothetical protein